MAGPALFIKERLTDKEKSGIVQRSKTEGAGTRMKEKNIPFASTYWAAYYAAAVVFWLPLYLNNGYVRLPAGKAALFFVFTCIGMVAPLLAWRNREGSRLYSRVEDPMAMWWLGGLCIICVVNIIRAESRATTFFGLPGFFC